MPEILCPNCGKENPDFFDACQFCQTPLHPEDTLHAGDAPSEKDTGELEQILPEWLQDFLRIRATERSTWDNLLGKIGAIINYGLLRIKNFIDLGRISLTARQNLRTYMV